VVTEAPVGIITSIEGLPQRYIGSSDGMKARFRLRVGTVCRDVVVDGDSCKIENPSGKPDAEIKTSPSTWRAMYEGRISGVEAFAQHKLSLRGSIQKSLLFEPLFEHPDAGAFNYTIEKVKVGKTKISTLVAGPPDAPPLVLIHGLGASNASWLTVIPQLARRYRVFAIDLPGFGASSKPRGRYDAAWFADHVCAFIEELGHSSALVAGNSMGGKIGQEMAMRRPDMVSGLACLCPATAFSERPGLQLARILRPELGFGVARLPRGRVKGLIKSLFAKSSRIDESWFDAAVDDFLKTWKSPRARMAFFASVRHIYLEQPHGDKGFWSRLSLMSPPALYIYGRHDTLITCDFGRKVQRFLPDAEVELWEDCGHVPQLEHPDRTADRMIAFFDDIAVTPKKKRPAKRSRRFLRPT
jgi:pimeloyl-ACP methyl ester carboxylesterase